MFAVRPEIVGAKAMPQIIVLPHLTTGSCPTAYCILVEQDLNRGEILLQVASFRHLAGEPGRINFQIVLRREEVLVSQVLFELEDIERLSGIVEHRGNRSS